MDEDQLKQEEEIRQKNYGASRTAADDTGNITNIIMQESGRLVSDKESAAAIPGRARAYIIAGWIFAALTAFIWPYIAVPGVIAGVLANMKQRSSGNAIIVTNIVLAAVNILFRYFILRIL